MQGTISSDLKSVLKVEIKFSMIFWHFEDWNI